MAFVPSAVSIYFMKTNPPTFFFCTLTKFILLPVLTMSPCLLSSLYLEVLNKWLDVCELTTFPQAWVKSPEVTNYAVLVAFVCTLVQAQQVGNRRKLANWEGKFGKWNMQSIKKRLKTKQNSDSRNNTGCVLENGVCLGWLLGENTWHMFVGRGNVCLSA